MMGMQVVFLDATNNYTVQSVYPNSSAYSETYREDGAVIANWVQVTDPSRPPGNPEGVFDPHLQEVITVDDTVQVNVGDSALNEPLFDILLAKVKQRKLYELENAYNQAMVSDFTDTTTGFTFGCDSYALLTFALQATDILFCPEDYPAGTQIYWHTKSNGIQPLTIDQFKSVCKSLRQHLRGTIQKLWNLQAQVNQATTIDQVKAIKWQ